MKKGLVASYVAGIKDIYHGETYSTIMRYFIPECITAFLIYSLPSILDSYFICCFKSTPTYALLSITNNWSHFIFKITEAFSVATVVMVGQRNGNHEYRSAGDAARDAFWISAILGGVLAGLLYISAYWIYKLHGVAPEMIAMGIPFLQLRSFAIFLCFMYMACIGFLRAIKNTRVPMLIFAAGSLIFIVLDYIFIFGRCGVQARGLQGSALASCIQYGVMLIIALGYILGHRKYRKYGLHLFVGAFTFKNLKYWFELAWPMVLDKATLAGAYVWLGILITKLGTNYSATFGAIKDLERLAFTPAIACAQIITFLVSNDYKLQNWENIKTNIKKIIFLASVFVFSGLLLICCKPLVFLQIFDRTGDFAQMAARIFPVISVLVFFDLLQLILSGALRGSGNVNTVMLVRLAVCCGYFVPVSCIIWYLPITDLTLKFVLIYGSFYVGNALMSVIYINRFRTDEWKQLS
ncbi:MATE family efflux transporter [Vermiphilus pyriformis]|jgi:MATE family multidrug resistance protein|uniref:MATE family efflux transporter n=1 Tax=candidate division TM6 bacterium JCVI TM6SC1 TaxID=1306947 RepID=A0A0D2JLW9_9BACT|nr:hypothetical protein J120_03500 [candidate division TM6 bacterium JCVI TM6SC1]UNE35422.1 MAG: MATE family efflux transporter [Vermiphilus pyriformis]